MPIVVTSKAGGSSVFFDISAGLDGRLASMPDLPDVAWQSDNYVPVIGTLYLRPTNIQGDTIAETQQDKTIGVYQVDVFAKAGSGKNAAVIISDKIADHFKQDTVFTYNGQDGKVGSVNGKVVSHNDEGWFHFAVEVVYYVFSNRR